MPPCVVPKPTLILDNVDGSYVLFDLENGDLYELSAVGAVIWQTGLDHNLDAVVDSLAARFPSEDRTRLAADARAFLSALAKVGLLVSSSSPPDS